MALSFASVRQPMDNRNFEDLDHTLLQFLTSNETTTVFRELPGVRRLWLHRRCGQAGVVSNTHNRHGRIADVRITKPRDYTLAVHDVAFQASHTDMTKQRREERRRQIEEDLRCDECGATLTFESALYHWSGVGPMCDDCVEADDELCGLKWETLDDLDLDRIHN